MASKMVRDRERSAGQVAQAAETHADTVGAKLAPLLAEALGADGAVPDAATLIRGLGGIVRVAAGQLVEADRAHEAELDDDAAPRAARRAAAEELYALVTELRASTAAALGDAAVAELGFKGPTPQEALALANLADTVAARLPNLRDRPSRSRALRFDPAAFEAALPPAIAPVRAALADVRREEREAEATLQAKQRAEETYVARFTAAASALTALFQLAGETELAARVRPSARRPGRTRADAGEPDGEDGAVN